MKPNNIIIRPASPDDAAAILAIYGPYIETTAITFEYEVPSEEDFRLRMEGILSKFPYLAAVDTSTGRLVAYAYANTFRIRKAYDWSVELSIYMLPEYKGTGIGRRLYAGLEQILKKQNILTMIACITDTSEMDDQRCHQNRQDRYAGNESVNFHRAMGFTLCGNLKRSGFKFGQWHDTVYMEKYIGAHTTCPSQVLTFNQVRDQIDFDML